MSKEIITTINTNLKVKKFSNGSYAYWSKIRGGWYDIPAETGENLIREAKE